MSQGAAKGLQNGTNSSPEVPGFLAGARVLELGDEGSEYCGKLLAGLGADVVKVEPPNGEVTRTFGPFYRDRPHPDRSLHFWHFNLGKRSIVLDLDDTAAQREFAFLVEHADVIIDARTPSYMEDRGLGYAQLAAKNPALIYLRIGPFGDDGPWADFRGSDLVHLALGGVMMNCGYDPDPFDRYDTPPVAPQMWHAYAIAGEMAAISVLGAMHYRAKTGRGQRLSASVHQAVSQATETDMPDWVFLRQNHYRRTGRHSLKSATAAQGVVPTKDGRYLVPYSTYLKGTVDSWPGTVRLLKKYGMVADLEDPKYDGDFRYSEEAVNHIGTLANQLVGRLLYKADLWLEGQAHGMPWAPVRRPEENVGDPHWNSRGAFFEVCHPELNESFVYTGARWVCREAPWRRGPRPPLLGEHTQEVREEWKYTPPSSDATYLTERARAQPLTGKSGKPFALSDIRVIDLGWMLASAGAGRYLAAMGAEVIKVEHESRPDGMRFGQGACPPGGRDEREAATEPLPTPQFSGNLNTSGAFMEYNAGKLSLSLNLKSESGRQILEELIRDADIILEGYSPGTMERMGFGYDRLKELNPHIVYVAQSGFGASGTYGRIRAYGPTAQALSGLTEMSGLPEPFPPTGIGYSYLDWFGAYSMAVAMLAGLYRRDATGEGCFVDSSQGEVGLYLTGSAILDYTVNGRRWSRYGNRSPYKLAAPHGVYPTKGVDRWIAISAFSEDDWANLVHILGAPEWAKEARFSTLQSRLQHQDALDELVGEVTITWDRYDLMGALQARRVPAGVLQNAQDRCEADPQLSHLEWLVEVHQTAIGTWPVKEHPVRMSETPAYMGGRFDRSGPNYGEDTEYVLAEILGKSDAEICELREAGAL